MDLNLALNFDCTAVAPNYGGGGSMFPESDEKGWLVQVTGGEMRQTRDKTGTMLVLQLEGLDEAVKGLKAEYRFNVVNQSAQATEIAKGQLSAVGMVCGVQKIGPIKDIAHKPFRVIIALDKNERLEIKGVRNTNGDAAPIVATGATAQAPQAPQAPVVQRMQAPVETVQAAAPIAQTPQWSTPATDAPWANQ